MYWWFSIGLNIDIGSSNDVGWTSCYGPYHINYNLFRTIQVGSIEKCYIIQVVLPNNWTEPTFRPNWLQLLCPLKQSDFMLNCAKTCVPTLRGQVWSYVNHYEIKQALLAYLKTKAPEVLIFYKRMLLLSKCNKNLPPWYLL